MGDCPFGAILMEGYKESTVWKNEATVIPVSHQSEALHFFEHNADVIGSFDFANAESGRWKGEASMYTARPSAGMKAFFSAALACDSLKVFGFGGRQTVDGHGIIGGQNFSRRR